MLRASVLALIAVAAAVGSQEHGKIALEPEHLDALCRLIRPASGESRWAEVPWAPATDIWAARKKAAGEGKPLFLWYMAGEPLGTC